MDIVGLNDFSSYLERLPIRNVRIARLTQRTTGNLTMNCMMVSSRGHSYWNAVFDVMKDNCPTNSLSTFIRSFTGYEGLSSSEMLNVAITRYQKTGQDRVGNLPEELFLLPADCHKNHSKQLTVGGQVLHCKNAGVEWGQHKLGFTQHHGDSTWTGGMVMDIVRLVRGTLVIVLAAASAAVLSLGARRGRSLMSSRRNSKLRDWITLFRRKLA
jgi:hypothetical protein